VQVTSGSSVLRVPAQVSPCGCRSPAIPGTLHSRCAQSGPQAVAMNVLVRPGNPPLTTVSV
jgi:hypothetical protein